ncbi:MAG: DUF459 domain-containing protein [Hyphomicrobiaceae bacterium]
MIRWLLSVAILALPLVAGPVRAQEETQIGTGYLELYPAGDVYQLQVVGDNAADGLLGGMIEAFRGDQRVQIKPKALDLTTLMRPDFNDQLKGIDDALARDPATIAVVMLGPQDRVSIKGPQGKRIWIDHDDWKAEFGRQIDVVMKTLKRRKIGVYWVSLPNVRRSEPNEDVQALNEIIRERAYLNGLKYIDAYAGFADEGGGYSVMGPDIAGKMRLLRESNGVSFTDAGNRKLAHFVERELRRDLTQAKTDRTIPLAGNEAEQAAIDNGRQAALRAAKLAAPTGQSGAAGIPTAATPAAAPLNANADQKADSGRINLALVGPGGREEIVAVDLLRPSIPATVIALVNRKENADKPTQLGDLLIDQIPGGLMVMSSITPATDPATGEARRRLSPTQTPYFRVMVKGERITPRAGRADDVSWPRPEPPTTVQAVAPVAAPVVPVTPAKPAAKGKKAESDPPKKRQSQE